MKCVGNDVILRISRPFLEINENPGNATDTRRYQFVKHECLKTCYLLASCMIRYFSLVTESLQLS